MADYDAKSRYYGEEAGLYEAKRRKGRFRRYKWKMEFHCLEKVLSYIPSGSVVLDLPAGTARFLPLLYQRNCKVLSGDISTDMLQQIPKEYISSSGFIGSVACDAEKICLPDRSVDYVLCMRFLNLVPEKAFNSVLLEMVRVCKIGLIAQIRFQGGISEITNLGIKALRLIKSFSKILASGDAFRKTSTRRNYLRNFKSFEAFVESNDLRIKDIYKVAYPLDSQNICLIERNVLKA